MFCFAIFMAFKKSGSLLSDDRPMSMSTGETSSVTCIPPCKSKPKFNSDSLISLKVKSETRLYTGLFHIESKYFCFLLKSTLPFSSLDISVASP